MSSNYWLSKEQFNKIKPLLPNKPRGVLRVDDRRVLSRIILCIQRGYRWSDGENANATGPREHSNAEYGLARTLCNRWKRWSEAGVFGRVFEVLAQNTADLSTLMIPSRQIVAQSPAGQWTRAKSKPIGSRPMG
ncbi:MAG: hypothetical protein CSA70_12145 [Rhodobacterales bacterium]|nr:MAG: hypothetical protein CR993_01070 [Rhodobacterales bacterium]PIE10085.1 MAG: hypothetical protein CSA70_12145 [Rhodobacterales bacterium]